MENPIKMDDLGVPLFSETSISSSKRRGRFQSTDVPSCRICRFVSKLELLELEELNGGKQRVSVDLLEHLQVDVLILTFFC